jgi:hypothetical protein
MMFRTHIREITAAQLRALGRWHTVFNARQPVITRGDLPCCKVWTPDDGGSNIGIRGGPPYTRPVCSLVVQIIIEGVEDEANARTIDDLCEAAIHHLVEDPTWLMRFNMVTEINTTVESNTEGEVRAVTATITFGLEYDMAYEPRIPDRLDRSHFTLPIPGQPEPPDGEDKAAIEFEVEHNPP